MSSIQHIVLLGSFSNLFLATSKFFAGWYYDSNALTAEGWHSIADLAMDAVTAFTVFLSNQFSGKNMAWSRYIEDAGSLVISSVLCVGGLRTLWQSWSDLNTSVPGVNRQLPSVGALWLPLLTIITKETIYNITSSAAKIHKSPVLASSAAHHRADGLISIAVFIALIGALVLSEPYCIDSLGGIMLSMVVLSEALLNASSAFLHISSSI
ncbi:hypothetical protein BKA59DRAFT_520824 [Fusarium tricinctum]|uniref:Cation efflux protein transmembrane domain-containing protein n=1 Tax=Fusarium tricinctum TaxID=61284 RepID=A0A8K0WI41_9HYPO|nr:hypothetical protein BKA59DRAFT_520824 [Fusarium tricinctum]